MDPRHLTRRAALATLAALMAGCAASPHVRSDQDPDVDLRAYRTFAFYDVPVSAPASLIGRHLRQATREQMERQHYVYSEQQPDLRVAMWLVLTEHPELRSTGAYRYRGRAEGVETMRVREGTLRIDLVDTRRNALVWRGVAEGRVDADTLDQPARAVQQAVAEIFAHYGQPTR
jgi:type IV pilus biogenesis protein CpaD/CtpE